MKNARGDNFKLLARAQTSFGEAEDAQEGGFLHLPMYGYNVAVGEDRAKDEALTGGQFSGEIVEGLQSLSGSMDVPIGIVSIGWHLQQLFGNPTTTGAGSNRVHTFAPDKHPTARYLTHCKSFTDVDMHFVQNSLVYSGFELSGKKDNQRARMTFNLVGRSEVRSNVTRNSSPVQFADDLVPVGFAGKVLIDGAEAAAITSFSGKVAANAEADQEEMNGRPTASAVNMGLWEGDGSLSTRFRDATYYDLAVSGTPVDIALEYRINANRFVIFTFKNAKLERSGVPASGREIISADFNWMVDRPADGQVPFEVSLGNGVETYGNPS